MQTNLGTKFVCSLATKSSNGFGFTNLDHSRSHKIEKNKKNGFGPFSYKFFVPIRVGLIIPIKFPTEIEAQLPPAVVPNLEMEIVGLNTADFKYQKKYSYLYNIMIISVAGMVMIFIPVCLISFGHLPERG